MSRRAICTAVRDHLREDLLLAETVCDYAPIGGMPPPRCGEVFVGVWNAERIPAGDPPMGLDEYYVVVVTVTMRMLRMPFDRIGPGVIHKESEGFDDLVDKVRLSISIDNLHNTILQRANVIIGFTGDDTSPLGFYEPLDFMGDSGNIPVGPGWFHSKGSQDSGVKCDMRFGRARRTQSFIAGRATS